MTLDMRKLPSRIAALLASTLLLGACVKPEELLYERAEAQKPIRRNDVVQTLAANERTLVAGTQNGAVIISSDGGQSWTRKTVGKASLIGLTTCPDGSFLGIDFNHKVWSGDATGMRWSPVDLEKPRVPLAVSCDARNRWHVAGTGARIARSNDQGHTWQVSDLNEDAQITAVQMIDETAGIAVGEFGLVAKTEDGGESWKIIARIAGEFYPYSAIFVSRKEGYVSGLAGTVLRTQDGGQTWVNIDNLTRAPLYRLFLQGNKVFGVGDGGAVAQLQGDRFEKVIYPDAAPVFLGAGASVPGRSILAVGGPRGLIRVIGTQVN